MIAGMFDKAELGIPCPGCGHKTPKKISWIKTHKEMVCAGCGSPVTLDSTKLEEGIRTVEKQLNDLKRQLSRIGKR